ncbi:MAG: ammonium transporter [Alphaproteobacteria bacterium]|nr:ammonium transporter [Alphaproteobacteria bacterium]
MAALGMALLPSVSHAQEAASTINSGDTAWMLVSAALVLLMTPGLAFFYAGMVRGKNVVSTLAQNMVAVAVIGMVWVVCGFSLAFVGDINNFIGDTSAMMLAGVGQAPSGTMTIPYNLFMAYQMMFAIITPALMTGAFAERVSFKAWILISILWSLAVYSPVAHWVWGGGWLADKGAQDFAGGFVVHMTAGYSALVAAIMFGKRADMAAKPYDTGLVVLGTALLWFGWFGFNAGSAVAANGLAAHAFVTTFIASAVAMLAWMLVDNCKDGKPTIMGGCIGVVAGLVAITPAAGFVTTGSAMVIGLLAGVLCNLMARFIKGKVGIDDTLDVFACHGIGGTIGVLSVGLFGNALVSGANGMFNGGPDLLKTQLIGAIAVAVYSMVATFVIIKVVGMITPVRVTASEEAAGLDSSQHGEKICHCD